MNDKDRDAIDHVASVSKNPHAAMIVKWLITGWDVIRKDDPDNIIISPRWHKGEEYELIEPKPAKPAYRVYIEPSNQKPTIVTKWSYDKSRDSFDGKVEWISDWIEYDQPKKWLTPLVERIAAIDLKAAEWIVDHWDELLAGKYDPIGLYKVYSDTLDKMFYWPSTEQGDAYWRNISRQLGE